MVAVSALNLEEVAVALLGGCGAAEAPMAGGVPIGEGICTSLLRRTVGRFRSGNGGTLVTEVLARMLRYAAMKASWNGRGAALARLIAQATSAASAMPSKGAA
jgi:hypothetical protein